MSSHTDHDADKANPAQPSRALRLIQGDGARVIDKTKRPTINQLRTITIPPWLARMAKLARPSEPWTSITDDAANPSESLPSGVETRAEATAAHREAPHTEAPVENSSSSSVSTGLASPVHTKFVKAAGVLLVIAVAFFASATLLLALTQNSSNGSPRPDGDRGQHDVAAKTVPAAQQAPSAQQPPVAASSRAPVAANFPQSVRAPLTPSAASVAAPRTRSVTHPDAPSTASTPPLTHPDPAKTPAPVPKSTSVFDTPIHPPSE